MLLDQAHEEEEEEVPENMLFMYRGAQPRTPLEAIEQQELLQEARTAAAAAANHHGTLPPSPPLSAAIVPHQRGEQLPVNGDDGAHVEVHLANHMPEPLLTPNSSSGSSMAVALALAPRLPIAGGDK